jgi:hypothetical protein
MAILIGKYEFDGPYLRVDDLKELQGLCVVLHRDGDEYELIHAAQADNVRECIVLSQAASGTATGTVLFAACYTPGSRVQERRTMVAEILAELNDQLGKECDDQPFAKTAS